MRVAGETAAVREVVAAREVVVRALATAAAREAVY
jgi:hypothetical protein